MISSHDPRHLRRRRIVQELFEWETQHRLKVKNLKLKIQNYDVTTQTIIYSIYKIDKIIENNIEKWSKDKINLIDLAILRLAVFELKMPDAEPDKVIIDEAVELAKEFGGESSPVFVNGVLAAIKSKK